MSKIDTGVTKISFGKDITVKDSLSKKVGFVTGIKRGY